MPLDRSHRPKASAQPITPLKIPVAKFTENQSSSTSSAPTSTSGGLDWLTTKAQRLGQTPRYRDPQRPMRPGRSNRSAASQPAALAAASTPLPAPIIPTSIAPPALQVLRKQWKWAAFSSFFYTFTTLVALEDITLPDIEQDLVSSTMIAIPRLMQRLLVTLTNDRKLTIDNWQNGLRKQYLKRAPDANPLGVVQDQSRARTREGTRETMDSVQEQIDRSSDAPEDAAGRSQDELKGEETDPNSDSHAAEDAPADDGRDESAKEGSKLEVTANLSAIHDGEFMEEGATIDWMDFTMLEKLDTLHQVAEWHFVNPTRLRTIMRSDDELASWRHEPIGYDAQLNAYWVIGPDRLWIQRQPPKKPKKPATKKRKATTQSDSRKRKAQKPLVDGPVGNVTKASGSTSRRKAPRDLGEPKGGRIGTPKTSRQFASKEDVEASPVSGRSRAAKTKANVKLDQQAKQLAAARAEVIAFDRLKGKGTNGSSSRPMFGTRVSRRLRGDGDEDEWQQIPSEWLADGEGDDSIERVTPSQNHSGRNTRSKANAFARPRRAPTPPSTAEMLARAGLEGDSDSQLTELSDSESIHGDDSDVDAGSRKELSPTPDDPAEEPWPPADFIEWETICVTLEDWENVAKQFEGSTNHRTKALHKVLTQEIVPAVVEMLQEIVRQRQKEEALMQRKRSSRLALKEVEREEARLEAQRKAEEAERNARTRRMEARAKKEECERQKRELAREQRRKEREEREERRRQQVEGSQDRQASSSATASPAPNAGQAKANGSVRVRSKDDWELDCEVCGSKGINRDDGTPMMCCGKCGKWQHIVCHDRLDIQAGRPKRNWARVEFTCRHCSSSLQGHASYQRQPTMPYNGHDTRTMAAQQSYMSPSSPYPDQHHYSQHGRPTHGMPSLNGNSTSPYSSASSQPHLRSDPHWQGSSTSTGAANGSMTFAHYQPQQRAFSSRPSLQNAHPSLLPPLGSPRQSGSQIYGNRASYGSEWDGRAYQAVPQVYPERLPATSHPSLNPPYGQNVATARPSWGNSTPYSSIPKQDYKPSHAYRTGPDTTAYPQSDSRGMGSHIPSTNGSYNGIYSQTAPSYPMVEQHQRQ